MIKNILFDLDGTLINTKQDRFNDTYYKRMLEKAIKLGYYNDNFMEVFSKGLLTMINNDGKKSNKKAFLDYVTSKTDIDEEKIVKLLDDFYDNEYNELNGYIEKISITNKAVSLLKQKGYNLILATNPLFPKEAIVKRANWGGIDCDVFSYITSYENSSYAKPNVNYYMEILEKNNLDANETIMFGNDLVEDLAIEKINVPCYIIKNNMINIENLNNCTKKGDYDEFYNYISNLPNIN